MQLYLNQQTMKARAKIKDRIRAKLALEISKIVGESPESVLERIQPPKNPAHGDLAYPVFEYAKKSSIPPPVAAEKLKNALELPESISAVELAGPFVNFRLKVGAFVMAVVNSPAVTREQNKRNIIVEYSSPNIAKPFHVGHLRATLLGNALDRVYRALGFNVTSINHLGDWGTQFGFVWAGCQLWGKPTSETVGELVEIYRKATGLKAEQEEAKKTEQTLTETDINEMARGYFRDLEEGKDYAVEFWKWCLKISMQYFHETYARLNVHFDHYTGESFYSDKMDSVLELLKSSGVLKESKGALGIDLGEELGFARVATPDGRSLYLTRDLATAKYRAETYKFDRCIYVVGAPQNLHFQQIKAVLKTIGQPYTDKIEHVGFGSVLGMKTRGDGEFVELNDFLDEGVSRALEAYHQAVSKRPAGVNEKEISEAVGLSAIVFSTLNHQRAKDVKFSWETAINFAGDSGPSLLYSVARLNGILLKAQEENIAPAESVSAEQFTEPEAFKLCSVIDDFERTLERVTQDNEPAYLCTYGLELSYAFSKAYQVLRVIGAEKSVASARLALFLITRDVLRHTLELLGMKITERM